MKIAYFNCNSRLEMNTDLGHYYYKRHTTAVWLRNLLWDMTTNEMRAPVWLINWLWDMPTNERTPVWLINWFWNITTNGRPSIWLINWFRDMITNQRPPVWLLVDFGRLGTLDNIDFGTWLSDWMTPICRILSAFCFFLTKTGPDPRFKLKGKEMRISVLNFIQKSGSSHGLLSEWRRWLMDNIEY